ncbi:MAG: TrkH family potassium uptake protein [Pseudomonadota bacterium]
MKRLLKLPFFVVLIWLAALNMLLPAFHAYMSRDLHEMRAFGYSALLIIVLITMISIALRGYRPNNIPRSHLLTLVAAYIFLPLVFAIPFREALPSTTYFNAYFEMLSSFTTTGASVYEGTDRLVSALELWRAQVGWLGGLFAWVTAAAIFFPLNLGGFEINAVSTPGRGIGAGSRMGLDLATPERLLGITQTLLPVYAGLTLVLWVCLIIAGDPPLTAFSHAASTMSTSGISPVGGLAGTASGFTGEVLIFLFLIFAFSRRTFSSDISGSDRSALREDPELRVAVFVVTGVTLLFFTRHWLAALETPVDGPDIGALISFWGGFFTSVSFLSTTGFVSSGWDEAQLWSGLETPGLILVGLALFGGGVATTAGGVKLLRVYALYIHGRRELARLIYPSLVTDPGARSARIKNRGY